MIRSHLWYVAQCNQEMVMSLETVLVTVEEGNHTVAS